MHTEDRRFLMSLATLTAGLGRVVLSLLAVAAASAIVSFPLWFVATRAPRAYAVAVAAVTIGFSLRFLWSRARSRRRSTSLERQRLRKVAIFRTIRRASELLAFVLFSYVGVTFFVSGMPLAGAAAVLILFVVLAALRMRPRRRA
jgi:phosphatidylglycerophosphate synthase